LLELQTDTYHIWYSPALHTVTCQGALLLEPTGDHEALTHLLQEAARLSPWQLILDMHELDAVDVTALRVFSRFVRTMQQPGGADLLVRGARAIPDLLDYIQEIQRVTGAAAAVQAGTFDPQTLDGVAARPDELGQLARVFQRMARELASREQQLQHEVQRLRIEIDLVKQARDVAAITDTDAFRTLQEQAHLLRARRGESEPEA
jgi:hypothetical protein